MSVRRLIVEIDTETVNVTEFCRSHGISRWFFYDLRRRYGRDGVSCLEPRSRAPKRVANKTPLEVEDAIVLARKQLDDAGLDAGPASIFDRLEGLVGLPSESTIWRILTARGLIVPEPRKAPKATLRSFTAERANECWQIDDTTWHLADGTQVKVLNIVDDHSRVLIGSAAAVTCTATFAMATMATGAQEWNWPEKFLSDNAPEFKHTLAKAVALLGGHRHTLTALSPPNLRQSRTVPPDPEEMVEQTAGRRNVDRTTGSARQVPNHLQRAAPPTAPLGRRTPAAVFNTAPKTGPATLPLDTTTRTWTANVAPDGRVWFNNNRATIGMRYAHHTALIITTGPNCHMFINGQLARQLELDPTQNRYPLP